MGTNIPNTNLASGEKIVPIDTLLKSISPEKLEDVVVTNAAASRVVNDPLPGPMMDAIVNQELEVMTSKGKVVFRPVVIYDFTIFKKLNSPHYRTMLEANSGEKIENMAIEDEELYEMIYQFTHTCKEIRAALRKGRDYFRELANEEIGDKYNVDDLGNLLKGVAEQIKKGFSTMMAHAAEEDKSSGDVALDKIMAEKKIPPVTSME